MRYLFIFALVLSSMAQSVTLTWQYPSNTLWSAQQSGWPYSFKIYCTNSLGSSAQSWATISNQPWTNYPIVGFDGSNYTFALSNPVVPATMQFPGVMFFTATSLNFWGESGFSNTDSVPPLPLILHSTILKN